MSQFARIYFYYNTAAGRVRVVENLDDSEVGLTSLLSQEACRLWHRIAAEVERK